MSEQIDPSAIEEKKSPEVNCGEETFEKGKEKEFLEYFIKDRKKATEIIGKNLSFIKKGSSHLKGSNPEEIWAAAEASSDAAKELIQHLEFLDHQCLQDLVDSVGLLIIGHDDGSPDFYEDVIPAEAWLATAESLQEFQSVKTEDDPLWRFCATKPPEKATIKRRVLKTTEELITRTITRSKYCYVYMLKDPLITEVEQAIKSIMEFDFIPYRGIYYGGHGTEDGDWIFRDEEGEQEAVFTIENFSSCLSKKYIPADVLMYSCNSHKWFDKWSGPGSQNIRMYPTSWYDCSTVPLRLSDVEKTAPIFRYLCADLIGKRKEIGERKNGSRLKKISDLKPVSKPESTKEGEGLFRIYAFRVNSADCTLVVIDNGKFVMLVDGAHHSTNNQSFSRNCWDLIGTLKKIDLVIVSHIDNDHIGGVLALLKMLDCKKNDEHCPEIKEIWFNQHNHTIHEKKGRGIKESKELYDLIQRRQKVGLIHRRICRGKEELKDVGVVLNILTPSKKSLDAFDAKEKPDGKLTNEVSISFILEFKNAKALFTADAHSPDIIEGMVLRYGKGPIQVDYADVPHHSSFHSFNVELPKQIKSKLWVISGNHRSYKHPNPEVVDQLLKNGDKVWLSCWNARIENSLADAKKAYPTDLNHFDQTDKYKVFDLLP